MDARPIDERSITVTTFLPAAAALRLEEIRAEQAAVWEAEQAELRARYPDAQLDDPIAGTFSGFDSMTPADQQEWIDAWRQAHPERAVATRWGEEVTDHAAIALRDERVDRARTGWERSLHSNLASPACQCCGQPGQLIKIGDATSACCDRCLPAVRQAVADHVAEETLGDGRTRHQAARALVTQLLGGD